MRVDLDHLPDVQQAELARVRDTLMAEFAQAISTSTQPWKKNGKILKIILFGSYSRDDWVDEPDNGYQSDFDLLVIVSHEDLTDIAAYWYIAEDKILHDPAVRRPVNIIVHTLNEVNQALQRGEYFWVDIVRDGVVLYELPQHALAAPKPLTPADALTMAQEYFDEWMPAASGILETARFSMEQGRLKDAAFLTHQATERLYHCVLLVCTFYTPHVHNLGFLRTQAERIDPRLTYIWPRETKRDRARFEKLKEAYVKARYSKHYRITTEELEWLEAQVEELGRVVHEVCSERLEALRGEAL